MITLLRETTDHDMELVLAWRNAPAVARGIYSQQHGHVISWNEHHTWWTTRYNWKRWIIQVNDGVTTRDVGCVNVGNLDSWNPEIGFFIGETTLWGKGVATEAVKLAMQWLKEQGYTRVRTTVLKYNGASTRLLSKLGFIVVGDAREGELYVEAKI